MLVGDTGIEPVTSSVSGKRSPAELIARDLAEVETGFEPVYTALQAVASPLGHSTSRGDAFGGLRADDGTRTRDPHLGKVMRYQLRYVRTSGMFRCRMRTLAQYASACQTGSPARRGGQSRGVKPARRRPGPGGASGRGRRRWRRGRRRTPRGRGAGGAR